MPRSPHRFGPSLRAALLGLALAGPWAADLRAGVLDKEKLLEAQTFWDNRDWNWYKANIPFFECPDAEAATTWYYRWELVTKHLTYGGPNTGYCFTEFIDRPFWSGAYGAISCPAGHQLYEVRWLRDPRYARDYARYWFDTPGAQPRAYSTWLADAVWAVHRVHPEPGFTRKLLPDLVKNYQEWEKKHFVKEVGLFWQTGHDDGMELNINSRQTPDAVRGAPGYRPTLNSYLWADARAIARVAALAGEGRTAREYEAKAARLKDALQKKLWDPKRSFFFHLSKRDEAKDGHVVKALTLTYRSGRHAGNPHGRELIGYVPWQFGLPDGGYESAWKFLMDKDYFYSAYGPTTVGRRDPLFFLSPTCCWWSGQSWPYATTQTLAALANLLRDYRQKVVSREDYFRLLKVYTRTHRKDGKPYVAEAAHPDTGSWKGHDSFNHSEHYFHSGYNDLIVTGLIGLRPRDDEVIEVSPLAPEAWDYFAMEDLPYRGRSVGVFWDRHGKRYGLGKGLHLVIDGRKLARAARLERITAKLPAVKDKPAPPGKTAVNFAVNNDGHYHPRAGASWSAPGTAAAKVIDGNYWYHVSPPNRWTCEGSPNVSDWCAIDFGVKRPIHTVKLYLLQDDKRIAPPAKIELEYWDGKKWAVIPRQARSPATPRGRRANVVRFPELETAKVRAVFTHRPGAKTGLTEFEAWGDAEAPVRPAPAPVGNLAFNPGGKRYPKASASFTSRFDKVEMANDGKVSFSPSPHNRWTSYDSPNATDWLEIDFGREETVGRVELALYDDGGGVRAPEKYSVQYHDGARWLDAPGQKKTPERPVGGQWNEVRFARVKAAKVRVMLTHRGKAKSGVSEVLVWP
jgi:hypothetical protein